MLRVAGREVYGWLLRKTGPGKGHRSGVGDVKCGGQGRLAKEVTSEQEFQREERGSHGESCGGVFQGEGTFCAKTLWWNMLDVVTEEQGGPGGWSRVSRGAMGGCAGHVGPQGPWRRQCPLLRGGWHPGRALRSDAGIHGVPLAGETDHEGKGECIGETAEELFPSSRGEVGWTGPGQWLWCREKGAGSG